MSIHCHCTMEQTCVAQIDIFAQLDIESLQKISAIALPCKFAKGDTLFSPGNTNGLYLISKGKVKVYETAPSGREHLLRVLTKGDFTGEESLFCTMETYAFGKALTEVEACFIRREDFLALLMQYPSISLKLLEEFSRRMIRSDHQSTSNNTEPVMVRIATYLLELSEAQDTNEVILPLPMKELAAFWGTTPETVCRRGKQLEAQGITLKKGRKVTILDKEKLKKLIL